MLDNWMHSFWTAGANRPHSLASRARAFLVGHAALPEGSVFL